MLQQAIYQRLASDTDISNVVTGIYDVAPKGTALPYITIGEELLEQRATFNRRGYRALLTMDVWSVNTGFMQAKEIAALVQERLHDFTPVVEGFTALPCHFRRQNSELLESDAVLRISLQFRCNIVEETV